MKFKAQAEMVGILIIVFLIMIGMLFLVKFSDSSDSSKKVFLRKGLTQSSLSAILKHNVDCGGTFYQVGQDLIENCIAEDRNLCGGSCEKVNGVVENFFNQTILEWGRDYKFTFSKDDASISVSSKSVDDPEICLKEKDAAQTVLKTDGGLSEIYIQLDVCDK